jgi:hypothetical protein
MYIQFFLFGIVEEGDLPEWLNTGLLECTMLQDFDNDNVLKMKGIAIDTKNIYIIYPAMANKTLKDFLISEVISLMGLVFSFEYGQSILPMQET